MNPSASLSDLSKVALVAADMAYKGSNAAPNDPLGEFLDLPDNGVNRLPYSVPSGWKVDFSSEESSTGFKVVAFRNGRGINWGQSHFSA